MQAAANDHQKMEKLLQGCEPWRKHGRERNMALACALQGKCERLRRLPELNELIATPPQSYQHRERSVGGAAVRCHALCASVR
jgi:ferric-dicitrate binding protein FerR (iron transport regulator)